MPDDFMVDSENQPESQYRDDGLAIMREGLPAALIGDVRRHLDGLLATLTPGQRPEELIEPHARAADWRFWLELCRHPVVLAAVARAMGTSELLLIMSHLIVKPAQDGKAVAWHQDITYWPSVHGTEVGTVWLAIDDVDPGNGCMQVIPRSHADALCRCLGGAGRSRPALGAGLLHPRRRQPLPARDA